MKAMVIIAHGSRRQASNEEVVVLSEKLKPVLIDSYPIIKTGFLELASPLIPQAIENCIESGANEIFVVPYFLSAGRHVQTDVPEEITKIQEKYPHIPMHILPHIGASVQMQELIKHALDDFAELS
jgi:sirohydrochlorin ferrochelatase